MLIGTLPGWLLWAVVPTSRPLTVRQDMMRTTPNHHLTSLTPLSHKTHCHENLMDECRVLPRRR